MPKFYGDWFHSRTSGKLSELATIQNLLEVSSETRFYGKKWGADRNNPNNSWIYQFSEEGKTGSQTIQPSTMQTKVRNFIRLGFLKDKNTLPLEWSTLGSLWSNSIKEGEGEDSNLLYRMIIANAISTRSFSKYQRKYDIYPDEDTLVVKRLINYIKENNHITTEHLKKLIDGDTKRVGTNFSYWVDDLVQSGLFKFSNGRAENMVLNDEFAPMIEVISEYEPSGKIPAISVIEHPLAIGAPFREGLLRIFEEIGSDNLLEAISTIKEVNISDKLIEEKSSNRAAEIQRSRSGKWSQIIKEQYGYKCAVPNCDAEGSIFIEAAHIMPFRVNDILKPDHGNDLNNGIALCLSCHQMYDAGLFTFDKNGQIRISNFIYSKAAIQNAQQNNVKRIILSDNEFMEFSIGSDGFDDYYTGFHKEHIFLGE